MPTAQPALVTFVDNRRKDRVLVRMTRHTSPGAVVAIFSTLDGRACQIDGRIRPLDRLRSDLLVSVPVPPGKTKASIRTKIRKAALDFVNSGAVTGRMQTRTPNEGAKPSTKRSSKPAHVIGRMSGRAATPRRSQGD